MYLNNPSTFACTREHLLLFAFFFVEVWFSERRRPSARKRRPAIDLLLTCICVVRLHDDVRPVQRLCLTMATPWQPFSGSLGACADLSSFFCLQVRARALCEDEERIVLSFGIFWSVFVTMASIFFLLGTQEKTFLKVERF